MAVLRFPFHLEGASWREAFPICLEVDWSEAMGLWRASEALDLWGAQLFEVRPQGQEAIPLQFLPGPSFHPRQRIQGEWSFVLPAQPETKDARRFVLEVRTFPAQRALTVSPGLLRPALPNGEVAPRPYPFLMQVEPQAGGGLAFYRGKDLLLGYQYLPEWRLKPFFYPVVGPAGVGLTRLGHPHDIVGHRHHLSLWVAHQNINSINFWEEGEGKGRQVQQAILRLEDGPVYAEAAISLQWQRPDGVPLLAETRIVRVYSLPQREWLMDWVLEFRALEKEVSFGKTPFGPLGVRVAKPISVLDGNGRIENARGQVNEAQVFWQAAEWCDYSGLVEEGTWNGITVYDHPENFSYPTHWHVRNDGWMGAALFLTQGRTLKADEGLKIRFRFYLHWGDARNPVVAHHFEVWALPPQVRWGQPQRLEEG